MRDANARRGFTLLELMITIAVLAILSGAALQAGILMDRGRKPRELVSKMQVGARGGLAVMEADLRSAALGAGIGVVTAEKNVNPVRRPSVQIFEGVAAAPGFLKAKPGTDALLVIRAIRNGGHARLVNGTRDTNVSLPVTDAAGFEPNAPVLLSEFGDSREPSSRGAVWVPVTQVDTGTRTLSSGLANALYPANNGQGAAPGSEVRSAIARLYYVNDSDELVQVELTKPYLSSNPDDYVRMLPLVTGVENLQVDCAVDQGGALAACPAPQPGGTDVTDDAVAALGTFAGAPAQGGARLSATNVGSLRTVSVSLAVRSSALTGDETGDAPIPIPSAADAGLGASSPAQQGNRFWRRAYRIGVAVRNTSLEAL